MRLRFFEDMQRARRGLQPKRVRFHPRVTEERIERPERALVVYEFGATLSAHYAVRMDEDPQVQFMIEQHIRERIADAVFGELAKHVHEALQDLYEEGFSPRDKVVERLTNMLRLMGGEDVQEVEG